MRQSAVVVFEKWPSEVIEIHLRQRAGEVAFTFAVKRTARRSVTYLAGARVAPMHRAGPPCPLSSASIHCLAEPAIVRDGSDKSFLQYVRSNLRSRVIGLRREILVCHLPGEGAGIDLAAGPAENREIDAELSRIVDFPDATDTGRPAKSLNTAAYRAIRFEVLHERATAWGLTPEGHAGCMQLLCLFRSQLPPALLLQFSNIRLRKTSN